METPQRPHRLRFGPFVLDTRRIELSREGAVLALRPKPFALLVMLASHPGTVLRKEDLLAQVWPGVVVTDDSLTQAVRELRVALGEDGPTLLRTVARHGYRLDAEVVDADAVSQAPRLSLVVLPMVVAEGSEGGDWFSDTLTMDLTANLGQISGMFVISRETAFAYKNHPVDPRAVARELNVRYLVRGTVGRRGQDLRLEVALIDGESGRQRWSERFELDRGDLPGSLRAITGRVTRELGVEVYRAEGQRAARLAPGQVEADDLAMQGWSVWLRGFSPENTLEALRLFEAAVARDPDSLRAWSGVALMNGQAATYGWLPDPVPARARQREALLNMERIDGDDMLTWFARVDPYYRRQDFGGLLQLAETLVQRFPNHPWSHHQHAAALMQLGRFDECALPVRRALQIGPRDTLRGVVLGMGAFCHFGAGRYAEAEADARQAVLAGPTQAVPQLLLAAALWRQAHADEARRIVLEHAGRPQFERRCVERLCIGTDPRLVAARDRILATLQELGVP